MNKNGQLGFEDFLNKYSPVRISLDVKPISISCGDEYTWILDDNHKLFLSGNGVGEFKDYSEYQPSPFIKTAARHSTSNFLADCGIVYSFNWKANKFYQSLLEDEEVIIDITCGETHQMAINKSGEVFTWGNNRFTKLGHETGESPKISIGHKAKQVAAGSNHSFILY